MCSGLHKGYPQLLLLVYSPSKQPAATPLLHLEQNDALLMLMLP
jgi:hypothetical protein